MALEPLATVADLVALGMTVEDDETTIAERYLTVASAAVRDAAGAPISETTSTVKVEGEADQRLRLPGPPVTDVDTVLLDNVAVTDWRLRTDRLWRFGGWTAPDGPSEVTVTYTHGLPEVPPDIVDLVCRMVAAALSAYRADDNGEGLAAGNITSERLGDWAVTYGSDGLITEMELPSYLHERLSARFGGGASLLRSR
ncbi:hypothetical protein [Streptomyces sp. TRM75563]|uniref:hypothetical protein n=1 Tax=Streptomyces sp. TRM75563 TaxID=2817418 RepID=UPI001F60A31D|nr:hypothetical protein [Streptomyces sp. TRM75563]MCI4045128.1 hypothetical protein [Streptomyces sp. TRM75563]